MSWYEVRCGKTPLHQAGHFKALPVYEWETRNLSTHHPGKVARKLGLCLARVKIHLQEMEASASPTHECRIQIYIGCTVGDSKLKSSRI